MENRIDVQVLLLPGLACDAALWAHQLEALAAWRPRVSDVHTRAPSLERMAATLLAEQSGALVLVGASMGGMLALEAARQAPARVAGLALLGTTARPDTPELQRLRREAIALFEAGRTDEVLRANVPFAFHPDRGADKALVQSYFEIVRRAGAAQLAAQNRAVLGRADLRPALAALRCPTLVLCGEADLLTPPDCSQEIAAAIPGARLQTVARAGHMLTLEQPAQVSTLLRAWLESTFGAPA